MNSRRFGLIVCSFFFNGLLILQAATSEFILEGNYPTQNDIISHRISVNGIQKFTEILNLPSWSDLLWIENKIKSLSLDDRTALFNLAIHDLNLQIQVAGRKVINSTGLYSHELVDLKLQLYKIIAKQIIKNLRYDSNLHYRLLSRDMDEIYMTVQQFLHPANEVLNLTFNEKKNLLERIALIPFSRKIVNALVESNDTQLLRSTLLWTENEMKANSNAHLELLDLGYFGSIVQEIRPMFNSIDLKKVTFKFIWKSRDAPAEINLFDLTDFNNILHCHPA
jgi:hypothetical protein